MMNRYLIVIVILCLIASILYKKWASDYALRQLYLVRQAGDDEQFLRAIDSDFIRLQFNYFTRTFMKLNYWIERDKETEVRELLLVFIRMKMKAAEEIALYYRLYEYALKKGLRDEMGAYGQHLEALFQNNHGRKLIRKKRG